MANKIQKILNRLMELHSEANAANEGRYTEGLDLLQGSMGRTRDLGEQSLGELTFAESFGDTSRRRLGRDVEDARAGDVQQLVSSGLYSTTQTDVAGRLRDRQLEEGEQAIDLQVDNARQQFAQMRGSALEQAAGAEAGGAWDVSSWIEGRSDIGPDMNMYAQLLQMLGSAAGSMNGASGGAGGSRGSPMGRGSKQKQKSSGSGGKRGKRTGAMLLDKQGIMKKWPSSFRVGTGYKGGSVTLPDGSSVSPASLKAQGYRYNGILHQWEKKNSSQGK